MEKSGTSDTSEDCYVISHQKMSYYEAERWCYGQNIPLAEPNTETDWMNVWRKMKVISLFVFRIKRCYKILLRKLMMMPNTGLEETGLDLI